MSTIAPLIGFLGTVSGMINAFDAIANADQVNAKVVAGGIKEALITTAAGLIVAIPTMSFYQFLTGKVNGFATEVEEGANKIYKELYAKRRISRKSKKMVKLKKKVELEEISAASMSDIAFLLLVFFMVTAVFCEGRAEYSTSEEKCSTDTSIEIKCIRNQCERRYSLL